MKKWVSGCAIVMTAMLLVSGCASTGGVSAPKASGSPGQPEAAAVAEMRHLNIKVDNAGSNKDGETVAGLLRQQVVNALAAKGLVLNDQQPDLKLNLSVQATPFDQSGNYHVYEADLTADAGLATGQTRPLGQKNFKVRSDRKLGTADALRSAADKLSGDVARWSAEVTDPARCGILANDVTVSMPWYRTKTGQSEYAHDFVKEVSRMNGVITCRVVAHDVANKTVVFRVVYFRDSFPEGLINELTREDDLHIKPKK